MPRSYRLARFFRFYGAETYRGASMRWPTRDRVIPQRLFALLEGRIANVAAAEQVQAWYASLLAESMVHGSVDGHAERQVAVKKLGDLAYPEV